MLASNFRLAFAAAAIVYLLGAVATGAGWEWEHDEGVSWVQAFGLPEIPTGSGEGVPIEQAYRRIDGQTDRTSAGVMQALTRGGGMHPPAYYLLLHHWVGWFGSERLVVRLPIYLAGLLSLLAAGSLASRLVNRRAAGWAMLLLAASPWFVGFSNLARPYALAVCAAFVSSNALLIALEPGRSFKRTGWMLAFAGVSILGLYTIYPYIYVLGWQLATWLLFASGWLHPAPGHNTGDHAGPRRNEFLALAAVVVLIGVCFAPWLPRMLDHLEITSGRQWYFSGSLALDVVPDRSWRILRSFGLGEAVRAFGKHELRSAFAALVAISVTLAGFSLLPRQRSSAAPLSAGARAAWLCAPLIPLAMLAADLLRDTHTLFMSRQSFALFPLLLLGVVRVWARFRIRWVGTLGLSCWLVLLSASTLLNVYTRAHTATAFETIAKIIQRSDRPTTQLILSGPIPGFVIPLLFSLRDEGVQQLRVRYVSGEALYRQVEAAIRDGEHEGVLRLVNFAGRYGAEDRWSDELLGDIKRRATAVGWDARKVNPGSAIGKAGDSVPSRVLDSLGARGPKLLILSPAGPKSFDP